MPTPRADLPVAVGVDRSTEALQAARYALREAQSRHCGLLLVHANAVPIQNAYFTADDVDVMRDDGEAVLEEVVTVLGEEHGPAVPITTLMRQGPASTILADLSSDAQCIVVGRRDTGWGERLLTDSVSSRVSAKSECAVVTVPRGWKGSEATVGPVVVALDGKSPAHASLLYAFQAADRHQADLVVLHAAPTWETKHAVAEHDIDVAEVLAGWRSEYPDVAVSTSTVQATATTACEDASRDAVLLVLGRSSDRNLLPWTRSVARAVLKNARCPVVTVPLHDAVRRREPAARASQSFIIPTY